LENPLPRFRALYQPPLEVKNNTVFYPSRLRREHKSYVLDFLKESGWFFAIRRDEKASLSAEIIKLAKGQDMKKFDLGRILATPGAMEAMGRLGVSMIEILARHQGCDWAEMDLEDREENAYALKNGSRIFSRYTIKGYRLMDLNRPCSTWEIEGTRIWVITEADRSATTILLPSEY
jgi:hypothetical protein